jgi:hypothetical protein
MALRLTFVILVSLSCSVFGQEIPDLLGKWTYTVSGLEVHARCGQGLVSGELVIDRKVTARAYRGSARNEQSFEKCQGTDVRESTATIRLKDDNVVTVDYDKEGWAMDRLRYVDGEMTGDNGEGVTTHWVRAVAGSDDRGLTAEQLAALDEFLSQVEPDLSAELSSEYTSLLQKRLKTTGLDQDEASQVAAQTVDRMTACMLDMIRKSVLAQEIPVDKILTQQNVEAIFNPQAMDMRTDECVQDASWNAGVRIR